MKGVELIQNKRLQIFMENEIPSKKNKFEILKNKQDEIFQLYHSGYAIHQIVEYLKITYKLIISRQTVSNYIKKELNKL